MKVEMTEHEREVLARLVRVRIQELGPEIHHTASRALRAELGELQESLERLEHKLADASTCAA